MEHILYVKSWVLPQFENGKNLEVRIKSRFVEEIQVGDVINFNETVKRRVIEIRRYRNFAQMSENEVSGQVYPGASWEEILAGFKKIYSYNITGREVLVFELEQTS